MSPVLVAWFQSSGAALQLVQNLAGRQTAIARAQGAIDLSPGFALAPDHGNRILRGPTARAPVVAVGPTQDLRLRQGPPLALYAQAPVLRQRAGNRLCLRETAPPAIERLGDRRPSLPWSLGAGPCRRRGQRRW